MTEISTPTVIRRMSNKDLKYTLNKMRKEKEDPRKYGKYGSSRFVTQNEFWTGYHGTLRKELVRRKKLGLIRRTAGNSRTRNRWIP